MKRPIYKAQPLLTAEELKQKMHDWWANMKHDQKEPAKRLCNRVLISCLNLKNEKGGPPLDGARCKKDWNHDGDCK